MYIGEKWSGTAAGFPVLILLHRVVVVVLLTVYGRVEQGISHVRPVLHGTCLDSLMTGLIHSACQVFIPARTPYSRPDIHVY